MTSLSVTGGTSDDTAALQAALAAATPGCTITLTPGTVYTFTQPLARLGVPFTLDGEGATLLYAGPDATTALTLGNPPGAGDQYGPRLVVRGLTLRTTLPRAGNSAVGLCVQNAYCATVEGLGIAAFGEGLQLVGDGTGCSYGRIFARQLVDNGVQVHAIARNGGFVSEMNFVGPGHFSFNRPFAGRACAHLVTETDGSANTVVSSLRFLGCCFEGQDSNCAFATIKSGRYIHWLDCRGETAPGQLMPLTVARGVNNCAVMGATTWMVKVNDPNVVGANVWRAGW